MCSENAKSSGQGTESPCEVQAQADKDEDDLEDLPMGDWPGHDLTEEPTEVCPGTRDFGSPKKRPKVDHDCVAVLQAALAVTQDMADSEVLEKAELLKMKIVEAGEKFGMKVQSALRLRERFLECWYNRDFDKFKGLLIDFGKIAVCRHLLAETGIGWLLKNAEYWPVELRPGAARMSESWRKVLKKKADAMDGPQGLVIDCDRPKPLGGVRPAKFLEQAQAMAEWMYKDGI